MCWCPSSVSGVHLPAFAAAEGGLFAQQAIEVLFLDWAPGPDRNLAGFGAALKALANGEADFALTSVAYLLAGQTQRDGCLGARFAAVFHQRNPIAGLVASDSELRAPEDLPGRRTGWTGSWFAQEYRCALADMGLGAPAAVQPPDREHAGLGQGEIEVIPAWVDMTAAPSKRNVPIACHPAGHRGLCQRARRRGPPAAGTGLSNERCATRRIHAPPRAPELGIGAFRRRFPKISEEHLRAGWSIFEPYALDAPSPGSMDPERWQATIQYTAATHGLSVFAGERVYRPELLSQAIG